MADARPDVFNHNVETVPRLYATVRPKAVFERSVALLARVKARHPETVTKSGLMLGLGEEDAEVLEVFRALREAGVDVVTVGQYLRPARLEPPGRLLRDARAVRVAPRGRRGARLLRTSSPDPS